MRKTRCEVSKHEVSSKSLLSILEKLLSLENLHFDVIYNFQRKEIYFKEEFRLLNCHDFLGEPIRLCDLIFIYWYTVLDLDSRILDVINKVFTYFRKAIFYI